MAHTVRIPVPDDAGAMARVHVDTWRETYRGLMPDDLLDDPELVDRRSRMWTNVITEADPHKYACAVAESDGRIVGIAMAGPPEADGGAEDRHLYILYAYRAMHGTGAGQDLLDAVVDPSATTALWVADPNPRARAFYVKNGFVADGTVKTDDYDGVREVRMVRPASS
jgi:GNAT superfamily N-acetyltransferase